MDKLQALRSAIAAKKQLAVALSGGIDSGLVAAVAQRELGADAVAVTIDSPQFPRSEIAAARDHAREIGIKHVILDAPHLYRNISDNGPERCATCKTAVAALLTDFAATIDVAVIADGANASDTQEHRPGIAAASAAGIWHPLMDAAITKSEARAYARDAGLSFADTPSMACLASRIPYGEHITREKLRQIEHAENALQRLGFTRVRVRHHGDVARIEVGVDELENALAHAAAIVEAVKKTGFIHVALDLQGYRSGAMDEALEK